MKRLGWIATLVTLGLMVIGLTIGIAAQHAFAADEATAAGAVAGAVKTDVNNPVQGWIAIAIGLVMGISCVGAGYAVGQVGSAALGAASENPEMFGRSLVFVGLAEGIAIYGLIVAILLLGKMGG